jgi:hypothetical protein
VTFLPGQSLKLICVTILSLNIASTVLKYYYSLKVWQNRENYERTLHLSSLGKNVRSLSQWQCTWFNKSLWQALFAFKNWNTVRPWGARFLVNGKTRGAQNLCNLSYLIRQRQDIKQPCCLKFSLYKFVHLKSFLTLFKNEHCQGPCSLRISQRIQLYS